MEKGKFLKNFVQLACILYHVCTMSLGFLIAYVSLNLLIPFLGSIWSFTPSLNILLTIFVVSSYITLVSFAILFSKFIAYLSRLVKGVY